jgi:hypothetical protein
MRILDAKLHIERCAIMQQIKPRLRVMRARFGPDTRHPPLLSRGEVNGIQGRRGYSVDGVSHSVFVGQVAFLYLAQIK